MSYTASFLTVNGLPLELAQFTEEAADVSSFERGGNLGLDGLTYAPKRRWAFETVPLPPHEAEALAGWLEGRGIQWRFDQVDGATTRFTLAGHDGSLLKAFPTASSTAVTRAAAWRSTNTKHANGVWALQLSGTSTAYNGTTTTYPFSHTTFTAPFGLAGYGLSLSYWGRNYAATDPIGSYTLLSQIWDVSHSLSTALYYVGSVATLGDANGLPFRRTSTFVATTNYCSFTFLSGASINSTSTTLFDSVLLVPYRLTSAMLVARAGRATYSEGALPYVLLGGHALQDVDEVEVKGFVEERRPLRVALDGIWYDNAEVLSGVFVEK